MLPEAAALDALSRDELLDRARSLGVERAELLTRVELRDEIIRKTETDEMSRRRARGWFGAARDLVASLVGQGLNLPDAAELIRGVNARAPHPGPPVATVTLAEIYAAQGHTRKALDLLDQVLEKEPSHTAAREAKERILGELQSVVGEDSAASAAAEGSVQVPASTGPDVSPPFGDPGPVVENDWVAALRDASGTVHCRWELTLPALGGTGSDRGKLALCLLRVDPHQTEPTVREVLVEVTEPAGQCVVAEAVGDDVLRVAVGFRSAGGLVPIAIGSVLAADPDNAPRWLWVSPFEPSSDRGLDWARQRLASLNDLG